MAKPVLKEHTGVAPAGGANDRSKRDGRAPRCDVWRVLLALIAAVLLACPPLAANQQWTIMPGQAIGPIRLGMTANDVLRTLGQPSSRISVDLWVYEVPFKVRIELKQNKVHTVTTWDTGALTLDGLRVGSPQAAVIRALGGRPSMTPGESGVWFFNERMGLSVFVRGGAASAFVVGPPQTQAIVSAPPQAVAPAPAPSPTKTQETRGQPTASGPAVVIENLSHEVTSTVRISGVLRNAGAYSRLMIAIVGTAETFKGETSEPKRIIAAKHLEPGEQGKFSVDLGKDLWKSYAVRVDSYSPMQSGDPRATASGSIGRVEYMGWAGEDLRSYVRAFAHASSDRIRVRYTADLPRYANVVSVVVRVGYVSSTWIRVTEFETVGGRLRLVQRTVTQTMQHQSTALLSPAKPSGDLAADPTAGMVRCMSISQPQPGQCVEEFSISVRGVTVEQVNWSLKF